MISIEALAGRLLVALLESFEGALAWKMLGLRQHVVPPLLLRPTGIAVPCIVELIKQRGQLVILPSTLALSLRNLSYIVLVYCGLPGLHVCASASVAEVVIDLRWPVALLVVLIGPEVAALVHLVLVVVTLALAIVGIFNG